MPAAAVLYVLFGAAAAVPSSAVGGVLPSLESVRLLALGVVTSWKQMLTVAVPVGNSGALLVPAYLCALLCATVGCLIVARARHALVALVAPVAMAAAAASLGTDLAGHPALVGTGLAVVALAWAAWWRRRAGLPGLDVRRPIALALVLIPALAGGLLLGPGLMADNQRLTARATVDPPFDPQTLPSPLSAFRSYVKADRDTVLFSVAGLPEGGRIRLAVMDDYNGLIYGTTPDTGVFNRVGSRIADVPAGTPTALDVQVHGYAGVWLPDAGYLSGIEFAGPRAAALTEAFRYDPHSGAGVVTSGLRAGDSYRLDASLPAVPDPAHDGRGGGADREPTDAGEGAPGDQDHRRRVGRERGRSLSRRAGAAAGPAGRRVRLPRRRQRAELTRRSWRRPDPTAAHRPGDGR